MSFKFDFRKFIIVSSNEDGVILFNGHQGLYAALQQIYPNFKDLPFSKQIDLLAQATVALTVGYPEYKQTDLHFAPKTFLYDCEYSDSGDFIIKIYDQQTELLYFSLNGSRLVEDCIIYSEYDITGIHNYLVKIGEMLPDDVLVCMFG